ncbi:hypothetical protein [Neisseria sp. S1]|uniref:hypothetical protein n=1 Tax=Neisseria sp. S1 TaxID=3318354 RepID=UPI003A83A332
MIDGLRKIPVSVYRSTDEGAPQLTRQLGSLNVVLKACLVTGYGTNSPLGWELAFEAENKSAFKSADPTSKQHYLYVDHSVQENNAHVSVKVNMTSLDSWETQYGLGSEAQYYDYWTAISRGNENTPWILIGHEKAFVLLFGSTDKRFASICGGWIYFGDIPTYVQSFYDSVILVKSGSGSVYGFDNSSYGISCFRAFFSSLEKEANLTTIYGSADKKWGLPLFNNDDQLAAVDIYLKTSRNLYGTLPGVLLCNLRMGKTLKDCTYPNMENFIESAVGYGGTGDTLFFNKVAWDGI